MTLVVYGSNVYSEGFSYFVKTLMDYFTIFDSNNIRRFLWTGCGETGKTGLQPLHPDHTYHATCLCTARLVFYVPETNIISLRNCC
jgi:hypothetical protein